MRVSVSNRVTSSISGMCSRVIAVAAKGSVSMAAALGSSASISKAASIGAKVPRARTLLFNRSIHAAAVVCSAGAESDVVELQLKVDGMVCDGCSSRVLEVLQKMPGVKSANVDLEKGLATVQVEAASQIDAFNTVPQLIEAVVALGFEAQPHFD